MHRRDLIRALAATPLLPALPGLAQATGANPLPRSAPIHVAGVGLRARDAEALAAWYGAAIGLTEISREGATIRMGVGRDVLLTLTQAEGLELAGPNEAGLFHTAFLLPSRRDLANWIAMAIDTRLPVDGSADHRVSEAIYLTDPEGNGIEIYTDRPEASWTWEDGEVQMGTFALDIRDIMSEQGLTPSIWRGAPAGTMVGHVHMKVGDATRAGSWWQGQLGFAPTSSREDAVFLSTGGYHHHVAVNQWMTAGAGLRSQRLTGLDFVALKRSVPGAASRFTDDWGTEIRLD